MSSYLRKAFAFGEDGVINPATSNQAVSYNPTTGYYPNVGWITDSGTRWVRIWAHLRSLWPTEGSIDPTRQSYLDYQIGLAQAWGARVILTVHHEFPLWVNASGHALDMPQDTSSTGPWCRMAAAIMTRYSLANPSRPAGGAALVNIFEFCNEPNGFWSVGGASRDTETVADCVAVLFREAKKISVKLGGSPAVGGPATLDLDPDHTGGGDHSDYYTFTSDVLGRLASIGFYMGAADSCCVWTQHNYADITYDQGSGTVAHDATTYRPTDTRFARTSLRSQRTAALLDLYGWRGFPNATPGASPLFLTEGGADQSRVASVWGSTTPQVYEFYQYTLMQRNAARLTSNTEGANQDMLTNYEVITLPGAAFQTALIRTDETARPAYTSLWKPLPSLQ